ncbi:MAG: hypothetical protein WBA16_01560 [Nonlabens sp.]
MKAKLMNSIDNGSQEISTLENTGIKLSVDSYGKNFITPYEKDNIHTVKVKFIKLADSTIADSQYIEELYVSFKKDDSLEITTIIGGKISNNRSGNFYRELDKSSIDITNRGETRILKINSGNYFEFLDDLTLELDL